MVRSKAPWSPRDQQRRARHQRHVYTVPNAVIPETTHPAAGAATPVHSYSVRICHWINLVACVYLLVSGVHIFLDFPELYWGHTGYRGYPAAFRLSDWGLSWDQAGAIGDRRWGRNYHFTVAWVFLINGLVYVGWHLYSSHFRNRMRVVDSMASFGRGTGGTNSDFGFHWFADVQSPDDVRRRTKSIARRVAQRSLGNRHRRARLRKSSIFFGRIVGVTFMRVNSWCGHHSTGKARP